MRRPLSSLRPTPAEDPPPRLPEPLLASWLLRLDAAALLTPRSLSWTSGLPLRRAEEALLELSSAGLAEPTPSRPAPALHRLTDRGRLLLSTRVDASPGATLRAVTHGTTLLLALLLGCSVSQTQQPTPPRSRGDAAGACGLPTGDAGTSVVECWAASCRGGVPACPPGTGTDPLPCIPHTCDGTARTEGGPAFCRTVSPYVIPCVPLG